MAELRRMRPLLGTYVEVCARGPAARAASEAAFASLEAAQARWSFQARDSELSRLNRNPGRRVALRPETLRLLRLARALTRRSGGTFDCTVGGTLVRQGVLPDHGGPEPLARGEADDIEIGARWARLRRPLRLTLDGIAKGYAVDLAIGILRRHGAHAGWVNAGGDLRVFGDLALPVQRREAGGSFTALGALRNAALASSRAGFDCPCDDFPGCIVGRPGQAPAPGVWTVLARSAWRADALTKVAAAAAPAGRAALIRSLGACLVEPATGHMYPQDDALRRPCPEGEESSRGGPSQTQGAAA
jgi:FAD:protein FMN transferase